ncbi:MAG: signal recognition particle protein Srp54 [Acidilobaceae archaeon]|nr:signal recognition particle protein Srp54 [Acidilobaceae archaeon]MDW7973740.1 signal recognition particle protein Srp54 [Sulfolobales archaeon]
MLEGLRDAVRKFLGSGHYERAVEDFVKDLQKELIRADVNVKLVLELSKRIKERALKEEPPLGVSRKDWFVKAVYEELSQLFGGDREPSVEPKGRPWIILLVGVQGSGKTTTAGKLALFYARRGYKVGLVSTDTHRPGAYQQLKTLAERAGAMFYGEEQGDPVKIAARGVAELRERGAEVIIVDTAGRHGYGEEEGLLQEMRRIAEAVSPNEVMLVIDAAIGQKAYDLASRFHKSVPVGSIIVSKADGTARGGGVLSAAAATGATVKFLGTGEALEELEVFRPKRFVGRVLGLGDIEGLLERLKAVEEAKEVEEATKEIIKGKITMRLLYRQLKSLRKMGPLGKVLQMFPLPIASEALKDASKMGEEKIDRWLAIMESMTYEELDKPSIIDRSRMRRIAIGSGTSVEEVKELLKYYENMVNLSKRLRRDRGLLRRLGMELPEEG